MRNLLFLFSLCLLTFTTLAWAKVVNLYEQPADNAKIVAPIDLSAGITIIFTPKEGEWIKIADPRNGNVGWIKSTEIDANTVKTTQGVVQQPNGAPQTYQSIQVGQPYMTPEQIQQQVDLLKKQSTFDPAAQKVIQDLVNSANKLYQQQLQNQQQMQQQLNKKNNVGN